jgi:hypothetical protein
MHSNENSLIEMLEQKEHFCTLFDEFYLPQGLALHQSLQQHAPESHLWILCMSNKTLQQLEKLNLANTSLLSLENIEDSKLLSVKPSRSKAEYCWTLTPFLPDYILRKGIKRVTYVDADLFFFDSPFLLIRELEKSNKEVLITEHAFDPKYDQTKASGRFCVQFLTFKNSETSIEVLRWWQEKCIEWCFAISEPTRFGDQKYLEQWPILYPASVHILIQTVKTLAPWNADFMFSHKSNLVPVFFHFHYFRLLSRNKARLFTGYKIPQIALKNIYMPYVCSLKRIRDQLDKSNVKIEVLPREKNLTSKLRSMFRQLKGIERVISW